MSVPGFDVVTFHRVFDVQPAPDRVSLAELERGLTHFILKQDLARRVQREEQKIQLALDALARGEVVGGPRWRALSKARAGGPEALAREAESLRRKARAKAKTDLRLWSPARYRDGSDRHKENVLALSCLVIDVDAGVGLDAVVECFAPFHRIVHTTWSYTPAVPKFRLVLPLARPVRGDDAEALWRWAQQRSGGVADPALKNAAATFALPAAPDAERPRRAFARPGPLFDAVAEHIAGAAPELPPVPRARPSHFRLEDPDKVILPAPPEGGRAPRSAEVSSAALITDDDFDFREAPASSEVAPDAEDPRALEDEFDLF